MSLILFPTTPSPPPSPPREKFYQALAIYSLLLPCLSLCLGSPPPLKEIPSGLGMCSVV